MRREPSEKTLTETLKAERQSECEAFKVRSGYLSFQCDGTQSSWKRQTRGVISPPPLTAEWVESPVWPPRVSASCNLIHGPQRNTAKWGSNRTKTHNHSSHLWMTVFLCFYCQTNEHKNIWENISSDTNNNVNPFSSLQTWRAVQECELCAWWLFYSPYKTLIVLACCSQHQIVKINFSNLADPCRSYF